MQTVQYHARRIWCDSWCMCKISCCLSGYPQDPSSVCVGVLGVYPLAKHKLACVGVYWHALLVIPKPLPQKQRKPQTDCQHMPQKTQNKGNSYKTESGCAIKKCNAIESNDCLRLGRVQHVLYTRIEHVGIGIAYKNATTTCQVAYHKPHNTFRYLTINSINTQAPATCLLACLMCLLLYDNAQSRGTMPA